MTDPSSPIPRPERGSHTPTEPQAVQVTPTDALVSQIEERFPNWRSFRDLVDCIDCTLHQLRAEVR